LIRRTSKLTEWIRKLSLSLLIGCTIVILISAFSRLALYEEAYGYTQTRLLVHGFMLFLGVLLMIAMLRIWKERFSMAKAYICVSIIAYVMMNYANLDARIASQNMERFERTGAIDIAYLGVLSADAAPALLKLQAKHPKLDGLSEVIEELRYEARARHKWQSWNWSEQRAK
jgi:cytochrome c oxidase subunit IV